MKRIVYRFLAISALLAIISAAVAETRPQYGGTLHVMMQSAPNALDLSASPTADEYWDLSRTLSLIGEPLVQLDVQGRAQPALTTTWQSDPTGKHWQLTTRSGVKFHDGSPASPAAIAQILAGLHPTWVIRASADSITIDTETSVPSLLAELSLPRNLIFKRNTSGTPIGTGSFLVTDWQPGKLLKLAANEDHWAGRPLLDAIEIEFGKSLRDQSIAFELNKTDIIETEPQAASAPRNSSTPSSSLSVELLALVFPANSKVQDAPLREAIALSIDRKPINSVLLKGAAQSTAAILPNWMTGYAALFSTDANPQRAHALLPGSRQPAFTLSYDPRDPQAQLIAERIALNARDAGITIQVSLSGTPDIQLLRVVLPSPNPVLSLVDATRQLGLRPPLFPTTPGGNLLDDLFHVEHALLREHTVIPLFHLPVSISTSARVRGWQPDRFGAWNSVGHSLADAWLEETHATDLRSEIGPR